MHRDEMKEVLITKYKFQEHDFINMSPYMLKRLHKDYTSMVSKENILIKIKRESRKTIESYQRSSIPGEKVKLIGMGVEAGVKQIIKLIDDI